MCFTSIKLFTLCILLYATSANAQCGAVRADSPAIDGGVRIAGMENGLSFNGLPRTGKYPGDEPDIGAWEWFPGVDCEHPLGSWTGVPLTYNPRKTIPLDVPTGLKLSQD